MPTTMGTAEEEKAVPMEGEVIGIGTASQQSTAAIFRAQKYRPDLGQAELRTHTPPATPLSSAEILATIQNGDSLNKSLSRAFQERCARGYNWSKRRQCRKKRNDRKRRTEKKCFRKS